MTDPRDHLEPRRYPQDLPLVRRAFHAQPDDQTCGPAAARHGLLLGGLTVPLATVENLLDVRKNRYTDGPTLRRLLRRLGFEPEYLKWPRSKPTPDILEGMEQEMGRGAFLLLCVNAGMHWICAGAYRYGRLWAVDSYGEPDRFAPPRLTFYDLTPRQLDAWDWENEAVLVRPGCWREYYVAWLPARDELLDVRPDARLRGTPLVSLGQALRRAAHQCLNDGEYIYSSLSIHLGGWLEVDVTVTDPGADAVHLTVHGKGRRDGAVAVRRVSTHAPGPAELVFRIPAFRASWLA